MNADGDRSPFIVAVAPTGSRRTKADNPNLPITPDEIADDARLSRDAGASMLHLHVRDRDGAHSLDVNVYRAAIAAVRDTVGDSLVIQITTEAAGGFSPEQQMACVRALRPEAASFAVRELFADFADEEDAADFLQWCRGENVAIQFIAYDVTDLARLRILHARGLLAVNHPFTLCVLGRSSPPAHPLDLLPFLAHLGADPWAVCAFGRHETECVTLACVLGGHARVGFENNVVLPDGRRAANNGELVAAAVNGAKAVGRPLADASMLREMMATWD